MPSPMSPSTRAALVPAPPGPDPDSGNPLPGLVLGGLAGLGLWILLVRGALALWQWVCP
jgi:hypothetical protein